VRILNVESFLLNRASDAETSGRLAGIARGFTAKNRRDAPN
jgi:hypothetical protein